MSAITKNATQLQGTQHLQLRQRISAWEGITQDKVLLHAIEKGVRAPLRSIPPPNNNKVMYSTSPELATTIMDYLEAGVITKLGMTQAQRTKYWVPIFTRPKKDSDKVRMITDLRELNQCHTIEKHRPQTWNQVCQLLQDPEHQWGMTLDLKGYFHHLGIHLKTKRWMRFRHQGQAYQLEAMPFGWSMSPFWSHRLSKPVRAILNNWGVPNAWFVDDILLLGKTKESVYASATQLIELFTTLGIAVNKDKTMQEPAQEFDYLGQHWNLLTNKVTPHKHKNESSIKKVKHQLKSSVTTPTHLAATAGTLIDMYKSNTKLTGIAQQLMRMAGTLAARNMKEHSNLTFRQAWKKSTLKSNIRQNPQQGPQAAPQPILQQVLQQALEALEHPTPKVFRSNNPAKLLLQTDASEKAWGATLLLGKKELATSADVWTANQQKLHITHRECLATALALRDLEHMIPQGTHLHLQTDSMATALAWKKGSKNTIMNKIVRPCITRLHTKNIFVTAEHIPGTSNKRADWLSRNPDPKNYQLNPQIFKQICTTHNFWPTIDLFANKHNRQCQRYCTWRMDQNSQGNAFNLNWAKERGWMNPPWDLIPQCIQKIKEDKATVLCCLPVWQTAQWWRELNNIMTHQPTIIHHQPLYSDPSGTPMPCPRWPTLFCVLTGETQRHLAQH